VSAAATRPRTSLRRIFWLLVIVLGVFSFLFFLVIPSLDAWSKARTLSQAMKTARSVTLVEFERSTSGRTEVIFQRVAATPVQMDALRAAISAWYAPIPRWQMMCYGPHHRVEVMQADGSTLQFEICFHCGNFRFGGKDYLGLQTLPASWKEPLARFFTEAGMAPQDNYTARARAHPDYQRYKEDEGEADAAAEAFVKEESEKEKAK